MQGVLLEESESSMLEIYKKSSAENISRFSEYEALESEMLTQLALDLKERTLSNGMLSKFVLINIAAQFYTAERSKGCIIGWKRIICLYN